MEIANLGSGAADLTGWKLAKRSASGAVTRCTLAPAAGVLPAGAHGLVVGGGWDGRYALPAEAPLFHCGATSLAGGLADERAPPVALESPTGAVVSGFGWSAPSVRCTGRSTERIHPGGEDATAELRLRRSRSRDARGLQREHRRRRSARGGPYLSGLPGVLGDPLAEELVLEEEAVGAALGGELLHRAPGPRRCRGSP